MSITRAEAEAILIKRAGGLMQFAGLDYATVDGTNADLADPIAVALRQCGLTVASVFNPADADLSALASADYDKYLALAEYRLLDNVLGNLNVVNISVGSRSESLGQLSDQVEKKMDRLRQDLVDLYGVGEDVLTTGVINLGFQEAGTASGFDVYPLDGS